MAGWIKIYRSILENPLWTKEKFTKGQAWIDLILIVNFEDKQIIFDGVSTNCKRGERITSLIKLSKRWGWSKDKVKRFLDVLQDDGMITYTTKHKKTIIKIVNYDLYQDKPKLKPIAPKEQKSKVDYIKLPGVDKVKLKSEEYESLIKEFGKKTIDELILDMDNYVTQKKKPYSDYNKAIRNWLRKRNTKSSSSKSEPKGQAYKDFEFE